MFSKISAVSPNLLTYSLLMDTLNEPEKLIFPHKTNWCPIPDGTVLSTCLEKQVTVPVYICGLDSDVIRSRGTLVNGELEIVWKEAILT